MLSELNRILSEEEKIKIYNLEIKLYILFFNGHPQSEIEKLIKIVFMNYGGVILKAILYDISNNSNINDDNFISILNSIIVNVENQDISSSYNKINVINQYVKILQNYLII